MLKQRPLPILDDVAAAEESLEIDFGGGVAAAAAAETGGDCVGAKGHEGRGW